MLAHDGWKQAYNPQLAVDGDSHLIVSTGLTQSAADVQELLPVLDTVEQINGQRAQQVLADAGYRSEDNFRRLEELGIDAVISLGREGKKPPDPTSRLEATRRMAEKLESPEGRQAYRTRKGTVEPVIGWIKQILGFRRFSLRGLRKVRAEWDLVCLAVDLRRMHRLARA
jgi:IS5 family transposase